MKRYPDGPHDVGLIAALVVDEDGWSIGLQLGTARCALDEAAARALADVLIGCAEHLRLGTASMLVGRIPADAPPEVIAAAITKHRRRT